MKNSFIQAKEMGMMLVDHDSLVEFIDEYPWAVETKINRAKTDSVAFWEPPSSGVPPKLIAIKKFAKSGVKDFSEKGECYVLEEPDYNDVHGRRWIRKDGQLLCAIASAGRYTIDGEMFSLATLQILATKHDFLVMHGSDLMYEVGVDGRNPPHVIRRAGGVYLEFRD